MLVGFGSTYYYVCMLHTWKVGNACTRFRNAPWILWIQGAALPPLRMWRSLSLRYTPSTLRRPSVPPAPSRSSVPPATPSLGVGATMVQSVLLEFDRRKAHTSFLFSALRTTLCSFSWAVGARARRHIEASAEGSKAAWSGTGSHCHAARQSQAVSLLLLQSDPTQWTVDFNLVSQNCSLFHSTFKVNTRWHGRGSN